MNRRLKSVLALLDSHSPEQLVFNFLELNRRRPLLEALMVGMVNAARQCIECYAISSNSVVDIQRYEVSLLDVSHPLVHVLRNGTVATWQTLHRGVRIEETRFRRFVHELPGECGLFAIPLFDNHTTACGVIAAFSCQPEVCGKVSHVFNLSCQLFQYQLRKLLELEQLRRQLRQIQQVFRQQQQRQTQLDQLLTELSSSGQESRHSAIARDYSEVNDLSAALESFERDVLTQRMRQFTCDKPRVAKSLNISLRSLSYRLIKYGCEL